MNPMDSAVADRAGHRCEYCRAPEAVFNLAFEVEHIVPRSLGGSDASDNLALACRACNLAKSDCRVGYDELSASTAPLFDPRTDQWDDHFQVELGNAEISGITAIGRATTALLKMNDPVRISARRFWIQLRLFP